MKHHILLTIVVAVCFSSALSQRPGNFRVIGPGGGGAMFNPTISPHDVNTVLISCDMTGSYITHDGGRSWRMFNLRGVVDFFVFDPQDSKTMYAHATGLWRSTDNGETWNLVYPKPSAIKAVKMASDHADEIIVSDPDPLGTIAALAIDPGDSKILYAAAGNGNSWSLFISHDSGGSWQKQTALPEKPRRIWVDPHSSAAIRRLFLGGANSLSIVSSAQVRRLPSPSTFTDVSLGFASEANPIVYGTSKDSVFVSTDGGETWHRSSFPGKGGELRAVATSFLHPETVYVSYGHLKLDGKTWLGVAKSSNSGKDWQLLWKESEAPASNVHDAWISERFGPGWGENPLNLTVAQQDPNLAYGTDLGRTMRTTDGGAIWTAMYSRKVDGGGWTTVGLDVTTNYGIHFDPFDSNRQFITYTDIGLFRSEDGGLSWTSSTAACRAIGGIQPIG